MRVPIRQLLILSLLLPLMLVYRNTFAQKNILKGTIVDTTEKKSLHYAIVALIDLTDTTLYRSVRSNEEGNFIVEKIPSGKYTLIVSYPKMADFLQDLLITDTSKIDLRKVPMTPQSVLLQEVIVSSGRPIRMRGDTLEYTADSFSTRANANVEELLKRLPGIYVERNGSIYAQGKKVQKILVDGDEFFSEDPGLAAQFLRADAIEKVQVYDQRSEQAEFTGIDDGVRTKTINLKLKSNKKKGVFGKLAARANTDDFHRYEAMSAYFDGPKKISVFGLASKVGNYFSDFIELGKYTANDYEAIEDGLRGMTYVVREDYDNPAYGAVPTVRDAGAHYSDKWNEARQKLFFNYRIRDSKAPDWSRSNSYQVLPDGSGFTNNTFRNSLRNRFSQKASASFSNEIDSFSTIRVSINGKKGRGGSIDYTTATSDNEKNFRVNDNTAEERSDGKNHEFNSNVMYKRSFRKTGRSLIISVQQEQGKFDKDNLTSSRTNYYDPQNGLFSRRDSLNQLQQTNSSWESYAGRILFADKLSKHLTLSTEYAWKRSESSNKFGVFNNKQSTPSQKVDSLSNDYDFIATTHIAAVLIGFQKEKFSLSAGGKAFLSRFHQKDNDRDFSIRRNFINWAPSINSNLRLKQNTSLSLSYSGQSYQPTVDQLQPIRRTTNNLYVQIGNPDLKPSFGHNANLSFSRFNMKNMNSWYSSVGFFYTQNGVTSQTFIDSQGRTISQYVNINGIPAFSGSVGFTMQNKSGSRRANMSADLGRSGDYRLQNNMRIRNSNFHSGLRVSLDHDWKDVMTTSYNGSVRMSFSRSSIESLTNRTISHNHTLNNSFFLPWNISITSSCTFYFQPANSSFNTSFNYVTWNASLSKAVFKNKSLVFKFEVNDIMNDNRGFSRFVSGANTYETERLVVKRFGLLSATWNFSKNL